nr:hypothetical protein Iba_scaffold960638CG0010 [Ipomoea batatas]
MVTHRRHQPQLSPRPSLSTREVSMPHVETGGGTRIVAADDGESTSPTSPELLTAGVFLCCCCQPNGREWWGITMPSGCSATMSSACRNQGRQRLRPSITFINS